jgi:hypothetical protein
MTDKILTEIKNFPSVYNADFKKLADKYFENRVNKICLETEKLSVIIAFDKLNNPKI